MATTKWKTIAAFSAVYVIWGSTYLAILVAIRSIPPLLMASLRFLAAGLVLLAWRMRKGDPLPSPKLVLQNSLAGTLTLAGGVGTVGWAEQYVSSSVAAIIVTAVPFWFVLFDSKQWKYYFANRMILAGLMVGFAGVALLVSFVHQEQPLSSGAHPALIGGLVILCGGVCWTIGSLYAKYRIQSNSLLVNAAIQFLFAGVFSLMISGLLGEWKHFSWPAVSVSSWIALAYLIFMGSLVAYLAYLWLINHRPAAQVSTYVYVNPVIAVLLGALVAREAISWREILALVVILCGVVMVNFPKYAGLKMPGKIRTGREGSP